MKSLGRSTDGGERRNAMKAGPQSGRSRGKTSGQTGGEAPVLIPQVHGGALLTGGQPGHKGAGGRPRNEVRELSLAGYFENLPRLIRIAAGTETRKALNAHGELVEVQPTFKESIEAMKELGNRGIGNRLEMETPTNPLVLTLLVGPEVVEERAREAERAAHQV